MGRRAKVQCMTNQWIDSSNSLLFLSIVIIFRWGTGRVVGERKVQPGNKYRSVQSDLDSGTISEETWPFIVSKNHFLSYVLAD